MPRVEVACDDTLAGNRPCEQDFEGGVHVRFPIYVHQSDAIDHEPEDVSGESGTLLVG